MSSRIGHGRRRMLFSSLLLNVRGGAVSPRAAANDALTLNSGIGLARRAKAPGRAGTSAEAISVRGRQGSRLPRPGRGRTVGVASEVRQAPEFSGKSRRSFAAAIAEAGAAAAGEATVLACSVGGAREPNAGNVDVNQMDQVTPQNGDCLIPRSRNGQSRRGPGQRSGRKGRA